MKLLSNYKYNCYHAQSNTKQNIGFKGELKKNSNVDSPKETFAQSSLHKADYALRVLTNKFIKIFESKKRQEVIDYIANKKTETSKELFDLLEDISIFYSTNKVINVNNEDAILERIAERNKSTIFIMNHSNQQEDPMMLAVLNKMLMTAYVNAGKKDSFQVPKIIMNQDILKTMDESRRKAFERFGSIGIDARVGVKNSGVNARALLPVMKDYIRDKCNIFIFPEGVLSVKRKLPMELRYQDGVGEMVNKLLNIKKEIVVVPVGFAYGKDKLKGVNGMQIGEPIVLRREGNTTTTTRGLLTNEKYADEGFVKFFSRHKDEEHIPITENGKIVEPENIQDFINSLLCENLSICSELAKERVIGDIDLTFVQKI